jgi:hypothetical protein
VIISAGQGTWNRTDAKRHRAGRTCRHALDAIATSYRYDREADDQDDELEEEAHAAQITTDIPILQP